MDVIVKIATISREQCIINSFFITFIAVTEEKFPMEGRFFNQDYPAGGRKRRHRPHITPIESGIFENPAVYDPLLAGMFPISMCIPSGGLDIICETHDPDDFESLSGKIYGKREGFRICRNYPRGKAVCDFAVNYEMTEIFAYATPTRVSNAFGDMIAESRILYLVGDKFRGKVIALKNPESNRTRVYTIVGIARQSI